MNIFICGANGFIGQALGYALEQDGHRVLRGVRTATRDDEVAIDFTTDANTNIWLDRLRGINVVINAVGILVERGEQTFDLIHHRTPVALFEASRLVGVQRIIQISALGAQTGDTRYFQSKRAADDYLRSSPVPHHILQPALVYGTNGTSSRYFRALSSLPVHHLPAGGHQPLRPIHVDELAEIVVRLLRNRQADQPVLELVGGTEVEYGQMLAAYRASMGLPKAWRITIPAFAISTSAALLNRVPGSMLTRDTWRMLQAGSTADAAPTTQALGRPPAGIETFIQPDDAARLRGEAYAQWQPKLLRGALAITWIWTAICSAFIYPQAESLALLGRIHVHGAIALATLYLAAALDGIFGIATILRPGRRLWATQAMLIIGYSIIVAIGLPDFLWHPFGPVLKNVPILALLVILLSEERRP
jgi:uncharacterized protein YbjT (DUF2867 family)